MHEVAVSDRAPARGRKAAIGANTTGKGKGRATAAPKSGGGLWRRARLPALTSLATAALAAILAGIVLNALVLQNGHHPAPLFSPEVVAQSPVIRPASPPHPVPSPVVPAADRATDPVPDTVLPKVAASVPHDRPPTHGGTKPRDRIAQLLDGTVEPTGRPATGAHAKPAQPATRTGPHPVVVAKSVGAVRPPQAREHRADETKTDLARAGQPFAADHAGAD